MILLCNIMVAKKFLSRVVLVLIHLALGVLVINSTCKDKRNSGNHDIIRLIIFELPPALNYFPPNIFANLLSDLALTFAHCATEQHGWLHKGRSLYFYYPCRFYFYPVVAKFGGYFAFLLM